jgi:hypothetical protein
VIVQMNERSRRAQALSAAAVRRLTELMPMPVAETR